MRIIAGAFRGRVLRAPPGSSTRPTAARVRESLFNHLVAARLGSDWSELRVLDLFAGSGALGIEALSRGAHDATFVERDPRAARVIRDNLRTLAADDRGRVIQRDAVRAISALRGQRFDLVFADPPYADDVLGAILDGLFEAALVDADGLVVLEHDARTPPPEHPAWSVAIVRDHGDTAMTILQRTP